MVLHFTDPNTSCGDEFIACATPDVCANVEENKEKHLLQHNPAAKVFADKNENLVQRLMRRDQFLLVAIAVLLVCMHLPYFKFILYPFMIFSTWAHEMGHGMAAVLMGGGVKKLIIYQNGGGLAYTWTGGGQTWKRVFVSSSGYTGTALLGSVMLLFRRARRGPTFGLIALGLAMLISTAAIIRNQFGMIVVPIIGLIILLSALLLPAEALSCLYSFLAATCSLNAFDTIEDLFRMEGVGDAGDWEDQTVSSDAHTVAKLWGGSHVFYAGLWLSIAIVFLLIGLLLPFDGVTYKSEVKEQKKSAAVASTYTSPNISAIV